MNLNDFPLLRRGMLEIMMDQYITGMVILGDVEVKDWEVDSFATAEAGLKKLEGRPLADVVPPEIFELPGYEDLKDCKDQLAISHFYIPCNDLDQYIADYSGMKPSEYWWAKKLLEDFFDGPLRERFQGVAPGSPYAKMMRRLGK